MKKLFIGIDFDGTIAEHGSFPMIGPEISGAIQTMKDLQANGHRLILYTMRDKGNLEQAVQYLKERDIEMFDVNDNHTQRKWSTSPKPYCHIYIDDAALGCPLHSPASGRRPYVNWEEIRKMLCGRGVL